MPAINVMRDTPFVNLTWSTIYQAFANSTSVSSSGANPTTYYYVGSGDTSSPTPYQIRVVVTGSSGFPPFTAGTITEIQFWDTGGTNEMAAITGLSVSAASFSSALSAFSGGTNFPYVSSVHDRSALDAIFLSQAYSGSFTSPSYTVGGAEIEGGSLADTLDYSNALAGQFRLNAGAGNDVLKLGNAYGTAATGGSGADQFVFTRTSSHNFVMDFDHGNIGSYSAVEGDTLDVTSLVSASYNRGAGQSVSSLVRIVEDKDGAHANLQVDTDGTGTAQHWTDVAYLIGFHQSETANVRIDSTAPALDVGRGINGDVGLAGDFNGDGLSDILWRNDNGAMAMWAMNGAQILAGPSVSATLDSSWHAISTADFNGDHISDILWRSDYGGLQMWTMYGAQVQSATTLSVQPALPWHVEATADFNGDGRADLLWRNSDTNTLLVWTMNGPTLVDSPTVNATPDQTWHVVGTGDFNHDGLADLLWRNGTTNALEVWAMNGATILARAGVASSPDASWHVEGVADFSGDGRADILWRNDNNTLALWTMNGSNITSGAGIASAPDATWHIASVGDFTGDGKADVLWRNDSGALAEWQMNGAQILAGPGIGSTPDQTWSTQAHHFDLV